MLLTSEKTGTGWGVLFNRTRIKSDSSSRAWCLPNAASFGIAVVSHVSTRVAEHRIQLSRAETTVGTVTNTSTIPLQAAATAVVRIYRVPLQAPATALAQIYSQTLC